MRRLLALIMAGLNLLFMYQLIRDKGLWHFMGEGRYFTRWGQVMTFFTFVVGSFVTNYDAEPIEDFNYQDLNFHHLKYTPFRTWKWYIFLFEASLIFESIISIFFWTALYPGVKHKWATE